MKPIGETRALEKLHELRTGFAREIRDDYEHRAKDCLTCETPGACCLDAHFVNVRITRLEAVAIRNFIASLGEDKEREVMSRVSNAITTYRLSSDDTAGLFACPLFEQGTGCLVHGVAKPLPCIAHACYENKEDVPPNEVLTRAERVVSRLNELTYLKASTLRPLPVAICGTKRS